MEIFLVEYVRLNSSIKSLCEQIDHLKAELDSFQSMVENLDIFWDGDANAEFIFNITTDIAFFEALLLRIIENVKVLYGIIKQYQSDERQIGEIIGGYRI